jgi:hypothetical protein
MDSDATGRSLKAVMKELPPELQAEVKDFAEFLLEKKRHKGTRPLSQNWAGSLRSYRSQCTSLDLQKKALEWRGV